MDKMVMVSGWVSAALVLFGVIVKLVRWVDEQHKQRQDIQNLHDKHDEDMKAINEEQQLIIYGILACLKGLHETGCNGPVTEAINKIDYHLNKKAHEYGGK